MVSKTRSCHPNVLVRSRIATLDNLGTRIRYRGRPNRRAIVNRDAVDWIVEGQDDEVAMPEVPVDTRGLLLKEFTGDVRDAAGADS